MRLLDRLNGELTRCQRHGGCVIVSHIDLRNLKDINDELGYSSGQRNSWRAALHPGAARG
jgi:GGDEF domain-containing protein